MNREYLIGISLLEESYSVGLIDLSGKIIKLIKKDILVRKNKKKYLKELIEDCQKLKKGRISGIGVSVPGYLDIRDNVIPASGAFNWKSLNIKTTLNDALKIPIFMDARVRCLAMAELKGGSAKKSEFSIIIDIDEEVTMTEIIDNKLMLSPSNTNFFLGHTIVNPEGPKCACKSFGCLNTYASLSGIKNQYALMKKKEESLEKIIATAKKIKKIEAIFDNFSLYLGNAIANLVTLRCPALVILTTSDNALYPYLKEALVIAEKNIYKVISKRTTLLISKVTDSGVIGAATTVKR